MYKRKPIMRERLAWILIYLNFPLWIAVAILAFALGEWGTVKILVGVNIALLVTASVSLWWKRQ